MQHVLLVHEVDAGADLSHEDGARLLGEDVVVLDDAVKQLSNPLLCGKATGCRQKASNCQGTRYGENGMLLTNV